MVVTGFLCCERWYSGRHTVNMGPYILKHKLYEKDKNDDLEQYNQMIWYVEYRKVHVPPPPPPPPPPLSLLLFICIPNNKHVCLLSRSIEPTYMYSNRWTTSLLSWWWTGLSHWRGTVDADYTGNIRNTQVVSLLPLLPPSPFLLSFHLKQKNWSIGILSITYFTFPWHSTANEQNCLTVFSYSYLRGYKTWSIEFWIY